MKKISLIAINIVLITLVLSSCHNEKKKPVVVQKDTISVFVPNFDPDSAFIYVKKQVDFGPRTPNSKAQKLCAAYLSETLKKFTPDVIVQSFTVKAWDGKTLQAKNIIASFQPEKTTRIMLSSHWDSRPFADQDPNPDNHNTPIDGANDGASGVGILVEIASLLSQHPSPVGVDIVLFDVEDYGQPNTNDPAKEDTWCLGSQYWSKNPHKQGYKANFGILLDMVGAENATFTQEGISRTYAQDIVNKVWRAADRAGFSGYFPTQNTGSITDDHYYINEIAKIPTVDIIHYDATTRSGFYKTWHTLNDNISTINKNTLKAVGQTLLTVIFEENTVQ
ncbi:MAG: M28 family peptidase [Bacteroidota bacterium]